MTDEADTTVQDDRPVAQGSSEPAPAGTAESVEEQAKFAHIVYLLQAIGFFVGITFIAGVVLNYIKKGDISDLMVASHFRWQIRTFWFSLLWAVIGTVLSIVVVGLVVLLINAVWVLYRLIKGWLRLNEQKPMYT